jgi:hypothetical protein
MANANTAGEVSLPETVRVSKILMRLDALPQVLFALERHASEQSLLGRKCAVEYCMHVVNFLAHVRDGHGGKGAFH